MTIAEAIREYVDETEGLELYELEGMYVECQGDDVIVFFPNIEA